MMKKANVWWMVVLMGAALSLSAQNGKRQGPGNSGPNNPGTFDVLLNLPMEDLSPAEQDALLQLREEEKLARDVYLALYQRWGVRTFERIAASEQVHMDGVGILLTRYALTDPVWDDTPGVFTRTDYQALYLELIGAGDLSLAEALGVGARIEELDLSDLYAHLETADSIDVRTLFQNLAKGSRNHLRAYVDQLELLGIVYTPTLLARDVYDAIILSAPERGAVDADGNAIPRPGWQ